MCQLNRTLQTAGWFERQQRGPTDNAPTAGAVDGGGADSDHCSALSSHRRR